MEPQIAGLLVRLLGCTPEKSEMLAAQLDKRAKQLAARTGRTYEEAMTHLLRLLQPK